MGRFEDGFEEGWFVEIYRIELRPPRERVALLIARERAGRTGSAGPLGT